MEEELICARCSKPINPTDEYTILKTSKKGDAEILCSQCRAVFQDALEKETHAPNILLAIIAGMLGAVVAGLIWYYCVTLTGVQFGLISILMGWLVGKSVVWGSGNKRGKHLQLLSLSLTIVAIIFSEYLILNHYFIEEFGNRYGNLTLSDFLRMYGLYFTEASGFFNILFYGIALWQAYRTPRMRELGGIAMNRPTS